MRRLEILQKRLPFVCGTARQTGEDFTALLLRYLALPKEPLAITVTLLTGVNPGVRDELHIDSMLGAAVVQSYPVPVSFDGGTKVVPVPLDSLWISEDGLPLWASSLFYTLGGVFRDKRYWHKRYPTGHLEWSVKQSANTSAGRWKEYRVPLLPRVMDTEQDACLRCLCIGNKEEIERLVPYLTHIGKKGTQGYGRVLSWTVEPFALHPDAARVSILNHRPAPAAYYYETYGNDLASDWIIQGWTPPYWYAPWHRPCLVRSEPDFFESIPPWIS